MELDDVAKAYQDGLKSTNATALEMNQVESFMISNDEIVRCFSAMGVHVEKDTGLFPPYLKSEDIYVVLDQAMNYLMLTAFPEKDKN